MKNKKIPEELLKKIEEIDYMITETGLKGYYKNVVVEIRFLNESYIVHIYHQVLGTIDSIEYFDIDNIDMFKVSMPVDYYINELGGK